MDRLLPVPVNRSRARIKRYALTGAVLMAVVFGVGALPVAFLYFWMPSNEQAGSQISAGGASRPQQSPRHNKDQAVAFVNVNVAPMDREQVIADQTVVVKDGKIVEITATVNAAEFLGATSGVVAVGRQADLILVNGDPLKDVSNASRRVGVMVRGQWLEEDELQQMLNRR
jgi:hypothetical protein